MRRKFYVHFGFVSTLMQSHRHQCGQRALTLRTISFLRCGIEQRDVRHHHHIPASGVGPLVVGAFCRDFEEALLKAGLPLLKAKARAASELGAYERLG